MDWHGYYINLDRATERRASIEAQLEHLGLSGSYTRFRAVDGKEKSTSGPISGPEVAIFESHLTLMKDAASAKGPTHVVEDDVLLSEHLEPLLDRLAAGRAGDFDVCVTDTGFSMDVARYLYFKGQATAPETGGARAEPRLIEINRAYLWGTTSYIVSPVGAQKFLALAEEEWRRGPTLPIDIVLQKAANDAKISVICSLPFVTWLQMGHAQLSSVERKQPPRKTLRQLARLPLFINRDRAGCFGALLREILSQSPDEGTTRFARFLIDEYQALPECLDEGGSRTAAERNLL